MNQPQTSAAPDAAAARSEPELTPLTVAVAGASGMLGTALCAMLCSQGYRVIRLVRHPAQAADEAQWDPQRGEIDFERLRATDALINLAGANLGTTRWTSARKQELLASRIDSTRLLVDTALQLQPRLGAMLSMSGVGYYGDCGSQHLDETAAAGAGFLAELCQKWEAELARLSPSGVRTVILRTGVVLTGRGGALAKMLPPFRLGLGGVVGSGRQYMSWISLADWLRVMQFVLRTSTISGPVNVVAPAAATNLELTRTLNHLLRRRGFLPLPGWLITQVFGEMGQQTLLMSQNTIPQVLMRHGFTWNYPTLQSVLSFELGLNS